MIPPLLDTNILIYAFTDDRRAAKSHVLLSKPFILSVQALNEFANVARRKLGMNWAEIQAATDDLCTLATAIMPLDREFNARALDLAVHYNLSVFDALMIAAGLQAGCGQCLSEDMHHGLQVDGSLTILNPFLESKE